MVSVLFFTIIRADNTEFNDIFHLRPMQYLGKISFSPYMWHTVVEFFIKRLIQYWEIENGILKLAFIVLFLIPTSIIVADVNFRLSET